MYLAGKRKLSRPGGSYSVTIPKEYIEEFKLEDADYVWMKIDGGIITIVPLAWQHRLTTTQARPIQAHSALEVVAQAQGMPTQTQKENQPL